jgi:hypothetical protein
MLSRPPLFAFLPFILLSLLAFGTATVIGVCVAGALGVAAFASTCRRWVTWKSSSQQTALR